MVKWTMSSEPRASTSSTMPARVAPAAPVAWITVS